MLELPTSDPDRFDDTPDRGDEGLSALQLRFVELVASGQSMGEAATEIGRSTRTLRRWKATREVAAAIRARLAENLARARAILSAGAAQAATSLVQMASGKDAPDSARVSAAKAVIENAAKLGELEDLEARLNALEARVRGKVSQ